MARKPAKRARKTRTPLLQRLRTDFLAGLVVILPLFLTAYIVWWTVGFVDDKVIPLIPRSYNPQNVFGRNIFGLGLILFIIFTTLVGALAKNLIGRTILQMGETILGRTPIIRPIYNGLKQIAETLFTAKGNSFEQACLVEYPRRGAWCVAFMTSGVSREIRERVGEPDLVSVFIPFSPNPTTGMLRFVPRADIRPLAMSLEDAAKLIISGGLVTDTPPRPAQPAPAKMLPAGAAAKKPSAPASLASDSPSR